MCDYIEMPDGTEVWSLDGDGGDCLCVNSDREILQYIAGHVELEMGSELTIKREVGYWKVSMAPMVPVKQGVADNG